MSGEERSLVGEQGGLGLVDARRCAFVCWVDLDGLVHLTSHAGYSNRQVAVMLRQIADEADRKADAEEKPNG